MNLTGLTKNQQARNPDCQKPKPRSESDRLLYPSKAGRKEDSSLSESKSINSHTQGCPRPHRATS